jgi:glutamyl-tRNA synthetase
LPAGATEAFWLAIRGSIDLLTEARHWWTVVNGTIFPPVSEAAARLMPEALKALPEEPWDDTTWTKWLSELPSDLNTDNASTLRLALTGEDQGPDLAVLLPLIGRHRVLQRVRGA